MILDKGFILEKHMLRQYLLSLDIMGHRLYFSFNSQNLKCKEYQVNQEWMMTIAYYRGAFR